jgi:FKBP-type peptidyl-prolyl cis-trans isomerase SlpA
MALSQNVIRPGSRVTLHFTLAIADGLVVDSAGPDEPLTIVIGQGDIAAGLEKYLLGLAPGEQRHVDIPAGEVHRQADPDAQHVFARADFPADMELVPGMVMGFALPSGEEVPATILTVNDDSVQVDFSHPLAGHDLSFDVVILAVASA